MFKKQLLCCSVVLLLLLLSKLYSYNSISKEFITGNNVSKITPAEDISGVQNTQYFASLNFANEDLPLGDRQIEKKMMTHLRKYSYSKLRSYHLHATASRSLPRVAVILRQHGVPEDFKYLPLIESGFTSGTTSHRGASGYWQFMPNTARAFGLRVDSVVDERQDIVKSTQAAAKYIKVLYREFNSWTLVAAAYNIGGGNLQRAINKQEEDNYFKLKLNKETGSYVYKLISVKEIIENPSLHGYRHARPLLADAGGDKDKDTKLL